MSAYSMLKLFYHFHGKFKLSYIYAVLCQLYSFPEEVSDRDETRRNKTPSLQLQKSLVVLLTSLC